MSAPNTQEPLASPSLASSSTRTSSDQQLHLESIMRHGHAVTVFRDADGNIFYPSEIPPETRSPTSPDWSPSLPDGGTRPQSLSEPPPSNLHPRESSGGPSNPLGGGLRPGAAVRDQRRATVTEMSSQAPPIRQIVTSPSPMKRAATNTSRLSKFPYPAGDLDSSSDSSSDEGDDHYRHHYRHFHIGNDNYHTRGKVSKRDGRLSISVKDTSNTGYLAKALGTAAKRIVPLKKGTGERPASASRVPALTAGEPERVSCPKLNIVIMVIGSRGDAQPFLKIGKVLKEQYGHRVRIATHPAFREFVEEDSGLEFFSVGGDPSELMAFMVKNPGMIPTLETVRAGDIGRRRAAMAEMFQGFWRACINATDDEKDSRNVKMMGLKDPFVADAIIANPPSFAHVHCAEALGIPLHLMFTFPYTPTQAFPHPLASIKRSNVDPGYTNFISYPLVEMMVWQGLGDLVNDFRVKTLGLDPVSTLWAPGATYRLHVPFTYLWSPALVPKPEDWGDEVDIAGFVFLDLATSFHPPPALTKFLASGEAPVYIGFGSIVVDDANRFTDMIFEAVKLAGVRALVSKGWGGLGGDSLDVPENIFMLDNTPHDWLFPQVRACVIHGGAGTTAIALKCGKPIMIVPFFGDQHFWGSMVGSAGAGPEPVPYKSLTAEKLAEGIKYCLTPEAVEAVGKISKDIELEGDGAENACKAFHMNLTLSGKNSMRCSILEDRVAVWQLKDTNLRLSPMAADFIVGKGFAPWKKLRLLRHNEWNDFEGPGEPLTGVAGSLMSSAGTIFSGIVGVPYHIVKSNHERHERAERRRKRAAKRKEKENSTKSSSPLPPKATEATDHAVENREETPPPDEEDEEEEIQEIRTTTSNAIRRGDTQLTASTAGEPHNQAEEFVVQVGQGAYKSASALVRAPVDLSLALAQGFHNAPRLYGDDTVRRPTRVTGIKSGLRAAGREFVYGIYDGWTGVVRLPVRGARDGGVRGFVTGVGMGLTGFVLKDIAAILGPVGYTLKGIVKQTERRRQPIKFIRRARIVQGQREITALDESERQVKGEEVIRGWEVMRALWMALELEEKKKGGLVSRFRARKRGKRSLGAAFESVETAERALAALRKGEGLKSVLGEGEGRENEDRGKSSAAAAAAQTAANKEKHKKKEEGGVPGSSERKSLDQISNEEERRAGKKSVDANGVDRMAQVDGSGETARVQSEKANGRASGCDFISDFLSECSDDEKTMEEKENPFFPSHRDVEKNMEDNKRTMESVKSGAA